MTRRALHITRGETWIRVIRWGAKPLVSKLITGITQAAPVVLHVPAHGMVDGWPGGIVGVKGMLEINTEVVKDDDGDDVPLEMHKVVVVDADHISIDGIDASEFHAYVSGGYLRYYTPADLSIITAAAMAIKDRVGGTQLELLSIGNGKIVLDDDLKTITLRLEASATEAYDWDDGVTDLEVTDEDDNVTKLLPVTPVVIDPEVTTS